MDTSVFNRIVRDIKDKNEDDEYKLISFGDCKIKILFDKKDKQLVIARDSYFIILMYIINATNLKVTDLLNLEKVFPCLPNKIIKYLAPRSIVRQSSKVVKRRRSDSSESNTSELRAIDKPNYKLANDDKSNCAIVKSVSCIFYTKPNNIEHIFEIDKSILCIAVFKCIEISIVDNTIRFTSMKDIFESINNLKDIFDKDQSSIIHFNNL